MKSGRSSQRGEDAIPKPGARSCWPVVALFVRRSAAGRTLDFRLATDGGHLVGSLDPGAELNTGNEFDAGGVPEVWTLVGFRSRRERREGGAGAVRARAGRRSIGRGWFVERGHLGRTDDPSPFERERGSSVVRSAFSPRRGAGNHPGHDGQEDGRGQSARRRDAGSTGIHPASKFARMKREMTCSKGSRKCAASRHSPSVNLLRIHP